MTSNSEWFHPGSLNQQNKDARNSPPGASKGDFGSYSAANRGAGLAGSEIEQHNVIDNALVRAKIYHGFLGKRSVKSIADIGCGLGYTANALSEEFGTKSVDGYEVSYDACEYASRTFPSLKFFPGALEPGKELPRAYDLVLCQEFYPFTRTNDFTFQSQYAEGFACSLTSAGVLLIMQTSRGRENSVLSNLDRLCPHLQEKGFSVTFHNLPFDKVFKVFPKYFVAKTISLFFGIVLRKWFPMAICISRK